MTERSLCLLHALLPGKIRSRIAFVWLGKHSQTSATPKAPRLLIPLKQQIDRTGAVKIESPPD